MANAYTHLKATLIKNKKLLLGVLSFAAVGLLFALIRFSDRIKNDETVSIISQIASQNFSVAKFELLFIAQT